MTSTPELSSSAALYLNLIEKCLTNTIYGDAYTDWRAPGVGRPYDPSLREIGRDWPRQAHTMIGRVRLRILRDLVATVIVERVPGDLIETGAWRGGACILMRAALEAFGDPERRVFVADSFEGLPAPDAETYPSDRGDSHHTFDELSISLEEVKTNFAKYGLLDDRVVFLEGWFKDTLAAAPIERLAVLRLDGDMYESTMDALTALYDKVSAGGFVIIDDYGCIEGCRKAVHDFRNARGIEDRIVDIDGWGVYWRKSVEAPVAKLAPVRSGEARPFWSVIVPLYERRAYLKECLDSVLGQDPGLGEMEILVADDASPSDLSGFVGELGRGRARYIRNPSRRGLYPSTSVALAATRGRFIHILHDDDWVENGFYGKMRRAIEAAPDVGVAFCQYQVFFERSGRIWSPAPFRAAAGLMDRNFLIRLATGCPLNLPAVVFARESFERIGLFRADLPMMADWEWYVRSAAQSNWLHVPEMLAHWRADHANQLTEQLLDSFAAHLDFRRVLEIFARTLPAGVAAAVLPEARTFRMRTYLAGAAECLRNGRADLAKRNVWEAFLLGEAATGLPEFAELVQRPDCGWLGSQMRTAGLAASTPSGG
jgi:O-methyltransferase/8-demethyl-8-(2,3-dimethoxy-alpha-L-rhamnosyl)tetracenomycin-C 4'-O-methyltransferase